MSNDEIAEFYSWVRETPHVNPAFKIAKLYQLLFLRLFKTPMSFDTKKKLLFETYQWQQEKQIPERGLPKEEQISEENIDNVVSDVGWYAGLTSFGNTIKVQWRNLAWSSETCRVFIPDPIV